LLKLDDVGAIVDADGAKFAENVLAEQAVEMYPQNFLKFIHIHHGDPLASPNVVGEGELHRQADGLAHPAGSTVVVLGRAQCQQHVAVESHADDGVVGARVEQEGDALFVNFAFDENHGFHGTEGHAYPTRVRAIGNGNEEKQEAQ
jgi:hypothetical protein